MRTVLHWACLLIFFLPACVKGQTITLSGKVQDNQTGEALPFASIGIRNQPFSTVSNLQGEFDFHFSSEMRNEILVISMLGYKNYETPIWSLIDKGFQQILMEKSTTVLQELVVIDSLRGGEIFRIALSRIEQNYPMEPFLLEGFYRDIKKVGGTYIALLEAAVKVYDENYAEPRNKSKLRERVKLVEVRKSVGYENKFTSFFGQDNLLEDLLLHNNIRYRQIEMSNGLFDALKREKNTYYNDHEVYVISYSGDFQLRVYIDTRSYAIVHLDFRTTTSSNYLERRKNLVSKFVGHEHSVDFRSYYGKMYLNYITVTTKEDWYDINTNEYKFQTELSQQFLVNTIYPNTPIRITSTEKMRNYGLQYQDYPYNKTFWENYNVIKETPLDRQIVEDLEKLAPLDRQFEEN